ncbi:MAG: hypothetical protein U0326_14540 [Polyangiales bacterium]
MSLNSPADQQKARTVVAYGDPDDHLRLTVLLANALRRFEPEAAALCRKANNNPWSQRFDALMVLLRTADLRASRAERPLVRVRDAGALPPPRFGGDTRWNDRDFVFERSRLRHALEGADSVVTQEREAPAPEGAPVVERFERALRPVARWVLAEGHLDELTLASYLGHGCERHVLDVAWDALLPSTRDTALRLSAMRAPQRLNGVLGPFPLLPRGADRAAAPTLRTLHRGAIDELLAAGFLTPAPEPPQRVEFPREIRVFLRGHATALAPEELREDHRQIALESKDESDEAKIERHHHAVLACDAKLAIETSTFYGGDLRAIGTEASLDGRYDEAAAVFREIVERFDPRDAYAWEYLGANLWWPHRRSLELMPVKVREDARHALERACIVDRRSDRNPLFHGRLLGFRGALGEDIRGEFERELRYFQGRLLQTPERISWFIKPVRGAFKDAGRLAAYSALCEPWRDDPALYDLLTNPRTTE